MYSADIVSGRVGQGVLYPRGHFQKTPQLADGVDRSGELMRLSALAMRRRRGQLVEAAWLR